MNKFLAIVKREYVQRVRTRFFVIMTILGPIMLVVFTIVPGLLFAIKTGGDIRVAIIDQTEGRKLYQPIRDALVTGKPTAEDGSKSSIDSGLNSNSKQRMEKAGSQLRGSFAVEPADLNGRPVEVVRRELNARIGQGQLDGYLVVPPDIVTNSDSQTAYYGRNVGDVMTRSQVEQRLNTAVRRQRLIEQGVKPEDVDALSRAVRVAAFPVNEKGEEGAQDSGAGFILVFIIAFMIYITVLLYGQVVLGAVIEEKETRIAEILFSSVRPFTIMIGKLAGVSLMALTQMAIWGAAFVLLAVLAVPALVARGVGDFTVPSLPPMFFAYFFLFFVLGYFLYSTLYVLIGSMVTTTQEGGQMAMPVVFLLMAGLYMAFPVIRSPNSSFAFWVSMFPFFAPITMIVRIVSQTPPLWQILLSLGICLTTIVLLLWLASRIYRVGMLMYGKKASIPEVMRWVKQS